MKYMLLVYSPENAWTPEEWTACTKKSMAICGELASSGKFITASPLHPVITAITVRKREGKTLITNGPFAETTEQLGGFYLINVNNLNEAIEIAASIPPASKGTIEIRPVRSLEGLPADRIDERGYFPVSHGVEYMFLCYDDEKHWLSVGSEEHQKAMDVAAKLTQELATQNKYVVASPLYPSTSATCVRVRDGKKIVSDGPFAETREVLGGFYLVLANGMNEAIQIAAKHSGIHVGAVEVRPVYQLISSPSSPELEIRSSRDFNFSRQQVFEAFKDPIRLARWWGPKGIRNTFSTFDFKPGGDWVFVMHGPDGKDYDNFSVFETISPLEKIVLRHLCPPYFQLTVTFQELGKGCTRLSWNARFATSEIRDAIARFAVQANEENYDRLQVELQNFPS